MNRNLQFLHIVFLDMLSKSVHFFIRYFMNSSCTTLQAHVGERRVSWATFYNISSGVFPVDRRMVGIVLKHDYILHIYPTSMKDEKND